MIFIHYIFSGIQLFIYFLGTILLQSKRHIDLWFFCWLLGDILSNQSFQHAFMFWFYFSSGSRIYTNSCHHPPCPMRGADYTPYFETLWYAVERHVTVLSHDCTTMLLYRLICMPYHTPPSYHGDGAALPEVRFCACATPDAGLCEMLFSVMWLVCHMTASWCLVIS